jgi:hypothetical protein
LCCKTDIGDSDTGTDVADWVAILQTVNHAETRLLAKRSFPLNLLPGTHGLAPDSSASAREGRRRGS